MTDARLVWDTWRRILTSDALVEAAVQSKPSDPAVLALAAQERAVFADYASTPVPTDTMVSMFRRGLVRNALTALNLVPMTRRLLYTSGLDAATVAEEFVKSIGYRDDGPYFWRGAADFVAYLATLPELSHPVRQDAVALDSATIAMVRRAGQAPPPSWPDTAALHPPAAVASERYATSRAAAVASTRYDLTPWLVNLRFAPDAPLEQAPRHWLIYLPNAEAAPAYAELSERAARAFDLLSTPRTAAELAADAALSVTEALEVIDSLLETGVVLRVQEPVTR